MYHSVLNSSSWADGSLNDEVHVVYGFYMAV